MHLVDLPAIGAGGQVLLQHLVQIPVSTCSRSLARSGRGVVLEQLAGRVKVHGRTGDDHQTALLTIGYIGHIGYMSYMGYLFRLFEPFLLLLRLIEPNMTSVGGTQRATRTEGASRCHRGTR